MDKKFNMYMKINILIKYNLSNFNWYHVTGDVSMLLIVIGVAFMLLLVTNNDNKASTFSAMTV